MINFGEKLRMLSREKGLSQEELADVVGVSRQAMSKWESNQTQPESDKLILLSEIFGVTIDSFIKNGESEEIVPASNVGMIQMDPPPLGQKRRLLVPLDAKGQWVAACFLIMASIGFLFNFFRYNENAPTLSYLLNFCFSFMLAGAGCFTDLFR